VNERIKVLIVDDSAAIRQVLTKILSRDPEIDVVGTASDPYFAREKIIALDPSVITLDVEMPRMDGLTFLEKLMASHPMPVVMVSSITQDGADVTLRALELGAVDFFSKPTIDVVSGVDNGAEEIIAKVKSAARANVKAHASNSSKVASLAARRISGAGSTEYRLTHQLIAIGASTGGTEAIKEVLMQMPPDCPPIMIVQHMPPGFTARFAERMDNNCQIRVKEAEDGDIVGPGQCVIAPGSFHMTVTKTGAQFKARVFSADPVNGHRPSVDVLFNSCAQNIGSNVVAAILTGMGDDGARGMRKIKDAGGQTVAQDEASCVVYGMPKEAVAHGGVDVSRPIDKIAGELLRMAGQLKSLSRT
jgi:two-component system chemotaxis response regulator CheB